MGEARRKKEMILNDSINKHEVRSSLFDGNILYHGTDQYFCSWVFPAPMKPGQERSVAHYGVFFTLDKEYAMGAGRNLLSVTLNKNSNILDCTKQYQQSEQLRLNVSKNKIAQITANVKHDIWHKGWSDGTIMRTMFDSPTKQAQYTRYFMDIIRKASPELDEKTIYELLAHNSTRGFIELMCTEAIKLGYDGLFGYEIDRWNADGSRSEVEQSRSWFAIFNQKVLSKPNWIIKN